MIIIQSVLVFCILFFGVFFFYIGKLSCVLQVYLSSYVSM